MLKVGIVGDGYTAEELTRLLAQHPEAEVCAITSLFNIGRDFAQVFPNLARYTEVICEEMVLDSFIQRCDLVFVALPHGQAGPVVQAAVKQKKKVIDLGADFRFQDVSIYETWYHVTHPVPALLQEAVYGLPELYRAQIQQAQIVANPGCYPTSAILGLAPAIKAGLLNMQTLIVDAKSGVSGAGRNSVVGNLFCEINESVRPYAIASHRHTPEIEQALSGLAQEAVQLTFSPHLVPMSRGILSTSYGTLTRKVTPEEIQELYAEFYADAFFVRVLPMGQLPVTKGVYGSNHCDIGWVLDERTNRLILVSAIDNLVKGASGQAIQNMNLLFGLPETCGLTIPGIMP